MACLESEVQKSIRVQRLGVESSRFLHDRQVCVMMMRGLFMGKACHSSSSSVKKWGIRMKTSVGSWFMGCRTDSRERRFGNTRFSSALLTSVTCKHTCEPGAVAGMSTQQIFCTPRQPSGHPSRSPYPFGVSSREGGSRRRTGSGGCL